jgi:hypothetical protein
MKWMLPVLMLMSGAGFAAELKPKTSAAFDEVIRQTEQRLDQRKPFLWAEESPARLQKVLGGALVVEPTGAKAIHPVPDGLVHDWSGAVFLSGVSLAKTLTLVRDYDRHEIYYKPEVVDARVLRHDGNDYLIFMRLLKKQVITVVLDTEHEVHYTEIDPKRWRSRSRTTKISEVEHAGKPDERILPPGTGDGFLWRLNSYWRFEERDGGTLVECQAISLTRDIPTGLGWLIEPVIRKLPRESLENTLRETRAALVK